MRLSIVKCIVEQKPRETLNQPRLGDVPGLLLVVKQHLVRVVRVDNQRVQVRVFVLVGVVLAR